ncbi:MAG: rhomboid family intramembrane serine protease [Wenzhouxiangellaceae bacterium]
MTLSLNLILIAVTVAVSYLAFNQILWRDRLILWPPAVARKRQYERMLTYGFIHADGQHLLFNMITLFFFGRPIENFIGHYMGWGGYLFFYLSAIVVAALPSYLRHKHDTHYMTLGASGAVSAVLFAFILLDPWSMILVFFIPMPALLYAVVYVGYSIYMDRAGSDNVNHSAHLWGAAYGVLFIVLMEPKALEAFMQQLVSPSF